MTRPPARGPNLRPDGTHGYYVDLREKAESPTWPPPWLSAPQGHTAVAVAQWGLACHERSLDEGEEWARGARAAGEHLLAAQEEAGGWAERRDYAHTFDVRGPWLSAMAQGLGASLLVRLRRATGDERYAAAARRALDPFDRPTTNGGVAAALGAELFPEEFPTEPPSFVLNGAIFALWGCHDVAVSLEDARARALFERAVDVLAANLDRWDLGWWSRYDLYPHPVVNVASPAYHDLHVTQLRVLSELSGRLELAEQAARFERYAQSGARRARALAHKIAFRVAVPKNATLHALARKAQRRR